MKKYAKETVYAHGNYDHIVTVHKLYDDGSIYESKIIERYYEINFGSDDDSLADASFKDAEFINGEYVVEQSYSITNFDPDRDNYIEVTNNTFFNDSKQKIRIEEKGGYKDYIRNYIYDEDGYLIKEYGNDWLYGAIYDVKIIYSYTEKRIRKSKIFKKVLQYANYGWKEIVYSYNDLADIVVEITLTKSDKVDEKNISEIQYFYSYDTNGRWINKQGVENGIIRYVAKREYGDFSSYFK